MPRFHIVWGTGPGDRRAVRPPGAGGGRRRPGRAALPAPGRTSWSSPAARSPACAARCSSPAASPAARPARAPRSGDFEIAAQAVVVTSGGIGGNHDLVRQNWPARLGPAPQRLLSGVPAHVDGRMLEATEAAGASVVNRDRMWHYTEGIANHSPVWARHGIRILPGPSSLWFDATGKRLPVPLFPGFDTLGTLAHIGTTGYEHTWFVATHKIVEKEFALSGSEQNPDLTGKDVRLLATRVKAGIAAPVQAFLDRARTSSSPTTLPELVAGMNRLTGGTPQLDLGADRARDRRPRPRDRPPVHQGPADHRDPRAPATTSATS